MSSRFRLFTLNFSAPRKRQIHRRLKYDRVYVPGRIHARIDLCSNPEKRGFSAICSNIEGSFLRRQNSIIGNWSRGPNCCRNSEKRPWSRFERNSRDLKGTRGRERGRQRDNLGEETRVIKSWNADFMPATEQRERRSHFRTRWFRAKVTWILGAGFGTLGGIRIALDIRNRPPRSKLLAWVTRKVLRASVEGTLNGGQMLPKGSTKREWKWNN